jgi:damage-control phosphatase, subfamily I
MKTSVDCLVCFIQQGLRVAQMCDCNERVQRKIVQDIGRLLPDLDLEMTPPANSMPVYRKIHEIVGCADPYRATKKMENERALKRIDQLRDEVWASKESIKDAIGYAIAGNIIDYGAFSQQKIEEALARRNAFCLAIDHHQQLQRTIDSLNLGAKVLYLADNCGEIVYDTLLVELLARKGLEVTVAVRAGAIINDALLEDAESAGLDRFAKIISSGAVCPGSPLDECSPEFLEHYHSAALVISKGQGNFETLSEEDRDIFFLLTVKCNVVGKHLAEIAGVEAAVVPGKGEMVVFYNPGS